MGKVIYQPLAVKLGATGDEPAYPVSVPVPQQPTALAAAIDKGAGSLATLPEEIIIAAIADLRKIMASCTPTVDDAQVMGYTGDVISKLADCGHTQLAAYWAIKRLVDSDELLYVIADFPAFYFNNKPFGCVSYHFLKTTPQFVWTPDRRIDQTAGTVNGGGDVTPLKYRFGWRDILDALELKNNKVNRSRVNRLNAEHDGPIVVAGRGSQPTVERCKLIEWWNNLEKRFAASKQKLDDKAATVEGEHPYGRDATVLPDLAGQLKRQRRKR